MSTITLLLFITLSGTGLFLFAAAITSFSEKEVRAGTLILLSVIILFAASLINFLIFKNTTIDSGIFIGILIIVLLLFLPINGRKHQPQYSAKRYNEEDAVLSRRLLQPGSEAYNSYYKRHPEKKEPDDKARKNAGLLAEGSKYYDPATFSASEAGFIITDHLHSLESIPIKEKKTILDPEESCRFIEKWLKQNGAHSVGFTLLEDHHLYSHKGRGERNGEEIKKNFRHAIAITVEMDHQMMQYAPLGPTVMESSQEYLNSGILATKLTLFIKQLGYEAKAHIDGNYDLICPLVAVDAGLGVIGRMGLLMTPKLGPRVRIAIVTTNLPLKYKQKKNDYTVIDFCNRCKKCADVCPSAAIPKDNMKLIDGAKRWQINSERCYNYWTFSGSDCGKCMISCPYSHPNNWFHQFIRWSTKNNLFFRRMAVKLDDLFYGRTPKNHKLSGWLNLKNRK